MSGRKRKEFWLSNQVNDQGSRPNSTHGSGRSTPDPYSSSQPTVDPRFSGLSVTDPRFSSRATPDQRRTTGPDRRQRSPVPQPTPYPSFSGLDTPNQQPITGLYRGRSIFEASSGGHSGPSSSSQPTVDPHFGDHLITDPRYSLQPTLNQQRFTDPYSGQPILEATSGGHPGPFLSSQPTVDPRFGDQSITYPHFGAQTTSYQQRSTDLYGAQRFLVPQPTPYPSFSGQATPHQQRITDPYAGQPIPQATSGGHPGRYSSGQRTVDPHFGDQSITDPRYTLQPTPNQQGITGLYPGGHSVVEPTPGSHPVPRSSGQPINDGIYTITNAHHHRRVYLEDANDKTPLQGHHRLENSNARWHVRNYGNEQYSIENVDHNRYADSGHRAVVKTHVEGNSKERLWRIQALPTREFTIATTDTGNLWMLPDDEPGTPVELSDVYTDRRCWWSFNSAEAVVPVEENLATQSIEPNLLLAPSGGPESAIVGFTSVVAEATDLLPPLVAACEALRAVLQGTESIGHVNEERKALVKRLKFHLATVENHIAKLEEDQRIDETIPALNQDVRESLETYARELKEIYEMLSGNQPKDSPLVDEVSSKTRKVDEAFQRYTDALHQFAANTVAEMREQLAQFRQEFQQGAHTAAETARSNRPNAYGIQHRECLQGTREKTLPAIGDWVDDKATEKWIFFFLDVAGSGKSTVAKHMAEKWKRENRLLARFFFSRDTTETTSTKSFCSTAAGAFAALDPTYKEHMDKFMEVPNVELLPFEERFEGLVAGPLRAIDRPAILIIDALDECNSGQRDQLLQTLRDQHSSIPFLRILATGRPERDIKRWANDEFGVGYTNFLLLEKSDKDVELYIKHTLKDLPIVQDRLYPVIRRAEGLFIWARVACDLLIDCDDIDGLLEELGKEVSLDYLYRVALQQSMPKEGASRRAMVLVLQMILAAKEPLSIAELEMLSPKHDVVEKVVTRLGSVLLYQGRKDPIRLLHATFREFLTTRSKANMFFIQPELGHHTLALGCLTTISDISKQGQSDSRESDAISHRKEVSFEQDTY